jgi:hypothetical protein
MQEYEILLAIPRRFHGRKPEIEAELLKEWPDSKITLEEGDFDRCSVFIPNSSRMTDSDSGGEVLGEAIIARAQEIVVQICRDDSSGF